MGMGMGMDMCIYKYIYIIYVYIYILYIVGYCRSVYTYVSMYVCMYVCKYVHIGYVICTCLCLCLCIYIQTCFDLDMVYGHNDVQGYTCKRVLKMIGFEACR